MRDSPFVNDTGKELLPRRVGRRNFFLFLSIRLQSFVNDPNALLLFHSDISAVVEYRGAIIRDAFGIWPNFEAGNPNNALRIVVSSLQMENF